jgi:hypothetical protein
VGRRSDFWGRPVGWARLDLDTLPVVGPAFLTGDDARRINRQPGSRTPQLSRWYVAQPPLAGPVLGWSRPDPQGHGHLLRLWIAVDEERTQPASFGMIVVGDGSARARVQTCAVRRVPVSAARQPLPGTLAVAVDDVLLTEADFAGLRRGEPLRIDFVSVHEIPEPLKDFPGLEGAGAAVLPPFDASGDVSLFMARMPSPITPQDAHAGLRGLRRQQEAVRQTALQARPSTKARRLRNAYPVGGQEAGAAWISKALLEGAGTANLCFVAASCQHPGTPMEVDRADASMQAIASALDQGLPAQFLCLLGDQIYADATGGLTDSLSPIERIRGATLRTFNAEGFRKVTTRLPTYMTLDDHEIEENWSLDRTVYQPGHAHEQAQAERLRDVGLAYVKAFQWLHSPRDAALPDRSFDYSFEAIDSRFYALDTRSQRRRFDPPQVCDAGQLAALKRWLATGAAGTLRVIMMGSVLAPGLRQFDIGGSGSPAVSHPAADNWQLAPAQRRQVLDDIAACDARNVVLLSGDYHCGAISVLRFYESDGKPIKTAYAIVAPPLYAPFPAASVNVHPKDVMTHETIALSEGRTVKIESETWFGQGHCVSRLEHLDNGQHWLGVNLHLTLLDAEDAPRREVKRRRLMLDQACTT